MSAETLNTFFANDLVVRADRPDLSFCLSSSLPKLLQKKLIRKTNFQQERNNHG